MAQNSLILPTTGLLPGLTLVQKINQALDTLITNNSGNSAPAAPSEYQFWANTTTGVMNLYIGGQWYPRLSIDAAITVVTATNLTVAANHFGNLIEAGHTSLLTLSLTAVATLKDGFWFDVVNTGTSTVVLDPNSSETIDGAATYVLYPGVGLRLQVATDEWRIVGYKRGTDWAVVPKTGAYTIEPGDYYKSIQATGSSSFTLTLPDPSATDLAAGFAVACKSTGTGVITVSRQTSATIDGGTSVILNPGEGRIFVSDGTNWQSLSGVVSLSAASSGSLISVDYFFTGGSPTWNRPLGCNSIRVRGVGGGGGGGGCGNTGASNWQVSSGGGAGGYFELIINSPASSYAISVGAGGAGGVGNANGTVGGTTNFGSGICIGNGGAGGLRSALGTGAGAVAQAVLGGTATGGTLNVRGGSSLPGLLASTYFVKAGSGGMPTMFGTPGGEIARVWSGNLVFNGVAAEGFGAGGSGALSVTSNGPTANGGAGAPGLIIIENYR